MKKLLMSLTGIVLSVTPICSVFACSDPKEQIEKDELTNLIIETDLGTLETDQLTPTLIIEKIIELNPNAYTDLKQALDDLNLDLESKILTSKNKYVGQVNLDWTIKHSLKLVIKNYKIGEFKIDQLTGKEVIKRVFATNRHTYKTINEAFADLNVNLDSKILSSKHDYVGEITLDWTLKY